MALKLGTVQVDFEANTSGFQQAEKKVTKSTDKMTKGFNRAATALTAFLSVRAAAQILVLADNLAVAERRIELLSDGAEQASKNIGTLKDIANQTGQEFKIVFATFENFKRMQNDIDATNDELLVFTATLTKMARIGGSSGDELKFALRQISQGLAGGVFRAEEFNSVIENTPEIAQAMAKGLNKSLGELRQMVLAGELLSGDVFNSILSQADETKKRFDAIPKSLSQLAQETKNILIEVAGEFDKSLGATSALGNIWKELNMGLQQWLDRTKTLAEQDENSAKRRREVLQKEVVLINNRIARQVELRRTQADTDGEKAVFTNKITKLNAELEIKLQAITDLEQRQVEIKEEIVEEEKAAVAELEKQDEIVRSISDSWSELAMPPTVFFQAMTEDMTETLEELEKLEEAFVEMEDFFNGLEFETPFNVDAWIEDLTNSGTLVDFIETFSNAPDEIKQAWLDKSGELVDTWGGIFNNLSQVGDNFRQKELSNQIEAVNERTDLSEEEKEKTIEILKEKNKEKSKLQKALLVAERIAALASIGINTAKNVIASGGLTPLGFAQLGFGVTQAAVVASTPLGGGRVMGGDVAPNMMTPVNENGEPEMLTVGSQQFLLTGNKGGRVTSGANMAANGSGMVVTVVNNAPGVTVTPSQISRE